MRGSRPRLTGRTDAGFTITELLVVIAILVALIAMLLPATRHAMTSFRTGRSLANLRQLGTAIPLYAADNRGFLPAGAYPAPPTPRIRWADAIWPYMSSREIFLSPQLTAEDMQRMLTPFAHNASLTFGGYGYNYQYLGNGRHTKGWSSPYDVPFHARLGSAIADASHTVAVGDSDGCKAEQIDNASGQSMQSPWSKNGVYTLDPPLASKDLGSKGARRADGPPSGSRNYGYQGGGDGTLVGEGGAARSTPGDPMCRATPSPRNLGKVAIVFCDGHAETMLPAELDDRDGDGNVDNGWWNGLGRTNVR